MFFYSLVTYKIITHCSTIGLQTHWRGRCRKFSRVPWNVWLVLQSSVFIFSFWRLRQYNRVFIFKGTKRNFSLTPLGGTVLSQWEHLVMQRPTSGHLSTEELVDCSTAPLRLEGHVTAVTHTARWTPAAAPTSYRMHKMAGRHSWVWSFSLRVGGGDVKLAPNTLCRRINQLESFPVFILVQKRLEIKKIFKKLIQAASSIQRLEVSVAGAQQDLPKLRKPVKYIKLKILSA